MLFFGCHDGWAYNLNAETGKLVWKFRAAPMDRQIVSYEKLESSWPLSGSVVILEEDGRSVVYLAAGRNTYLDGGIYLYGIDAETGEVLYKNKIMNEDMDETKKYNSHQLEGAQLDLFVFDGKYLSMQSKVFDRTLQSVRLPDKPHLYATGGFLDDQAWHRNFWTYSKGWTAMNKDTSTFPNAGQLMSHDGNLNYGIKYYTIKQGQSMAVYPGQKGYYLFCDDDSDSWNNLLIDSLEPKKKGKKSKKKKSKDSAGLKIINTPTFGVSSKVLNKNWEKDPLRKWGKWIPMRVRAMVKTADMLFIAGIEDKAIGKDDMDIYLGKGKGLFWAVNPENGTVEAKYTTDAPPVFDGLMAAEGRLFISLENGNLQCGSK